jgi:outer membrane protein OmpA-like peptidoglycan-associated protein
MNKSKKTQQPIKSVHNTIYTVEGRKISFDQQIVGPKEIHISTDKLQPGVYIVEMTNNLNERNYQKFIKKYFCFFNNLDKKFNSMIKKITILTIVTLSSLFAPAQNLVKNPSFEDYSMYHGGGKDIQHARGWEQSFNMNYISSSTPDLICVSKYQKGDLSPIVNIEPLSARTGDCIGGYLVDEFLVVELLDSLVKDSLYSFSFFYKLAPCSGFYTTKMFFQLFKKEEMQLDKITSDLKFREVCKRMVNSGTCTQGDDKLNWNEFKAPYRAVGGENCLMFGICGLGVLESKEINFIKQLKIGQAGAVLDRNEIRSPYYFIDDVSVTGAIAPLKKGVPLNIYSILFQVNSCHIDSNSFSYLNELAAYLNTDKSLQIEITGHTDNIGNDADNLILSYARAEAVKTYFATFGIAPKRISVFGKGESEPIASNSTAEGRAKNRRIEILVR